MFVLQEAQAEYHLLSHHISLPIRKWTGVMFKQLLQGYTCVSLVPAPL